MCRIGLELRTTTQEGLNITSATGRYRVQGTSVWNTFSINLSDPRTPDINIVGIYELQVNVSDNSGSVSIWSNTEVFEVSEDCGDGGTTEASQCGYWGVTNNSTSATVNFPYIDCDGQDTFNTTGGSGDFADSFGNLEIPPRTTLNICGVIVQNLIDANPTLTFVYLGDRCP